MWMTVLPTSCFAGSCWLRKTGRQVPCWCQSSGSALTWFVPYSLQRTGSLFPFPMFYLNLCEMLEHGKRPPISRLILLSNLQAQTELHSVMWPFALPVLSKPWLHAAQVVSNEVISTRISAILATVWEIQSLHYKKQNRTEQRNTQQLGFA